MTVYLVTFLQKYLGLARTIYIRCIYGIFGREIIKYTVIYGVYIQFWPTLHIIFQPYTANYLHNTVDFHSMQNM